MFRKLKHRGFTLIELLVVIAIIGIITSIVVGSTTVSHTKSRDYTRISDLHFIQLTLGVYYDVYKSYPANLNTLVTGGFMSSVPVDPFSKVAYPYSSGTKYCLGAFMEDATAIPKDNAACTLNTCTNHLTGAINVACNYTVQR